MKKKILSLFLILATVAALLPAIALVSFASGDEYTPDYEDYESLWVQDGLSSFVDMTNMTGTDDARLVTVGNSTYVQIKDGANAGKYYLLAGEASVKDGKLHLSTAEDPSSGTNEWYKSEGVMFGNVYSYDGSAMSAEADASVVRNEAKNNAYTVDYNAYVAGITYADGTDAEINIFSKLISGPYSIGCFNYYPSSTGINFCWSFGSRTTAIDRNVFFSTNIIWDARIVLRDNNDAKKTQGDSYHMALTVGFGESAGTASFMPVTNGAVSSFSWSALAASELNNTRMSASASNLLLSSTSQEFHFIRVYNRALTREEVAKNHFADLVYYYGVDLRSYDLSAMSEDFYNSFTKYDIGSTDKEALAKTVRDEYYKEQNLDLYYDDGHLMAFVDVTDNDNSNLVRISPVNNSTAAGYHNYIKIIDGDLAGKYYMTGVSSSIQTTSLQGIVAASSNISHGASTYKIHVGTSFEESVIFTNTGAIGALDGYMNPASSEGFTIEAATKFITSTHSGVAFATMIFNASKSSDNHLAGIANRHSGSASALIMGAYGGVEAQSAMGTIGDDLSATVASHVRYDDFTDYNAIRSAIALTPKNDVNANSGFVKIAESSAAAVTWNTLTNIGENDDIVVSAAGHSYYYIRTYDCELSEAQMKQNLLADIARYNAMDMSDFRTLSDAEKAVVYDTALAYGVPSALLTLEKTRAASSQFLRTKTKRFAYTEDTRLRKAGLKRSLTSQFSPVL